MIREFLGFTTRDQFRTRSPEKDESADRALLDPIAAAIEQALTSLQGERDGLARRVEDTLGHASIVAGNDIYEHDTRDEVRTHALQGFERELANAKGRLAAVETHITNLKSVRAAFLARFPTS